MRESPVQSCLVLVVDDDTRVTAAVIDELKFNGCVVVEALSGEGAMTCLSARYAVDVLFTDLSLGGQMDGWDVAEAFRGAIPDIGVIYTSGESIEPRRTVPGSLFFSKPYSPTAVSAACLRLVQESAARRLAASSSPDN